MNFAPIYALLERRTGLDPNTLGAHAVHQTILARLRAREVDLVGYAELLSRDEREFTTLVNELVVPETWFFRGGTLFGYLAEHLRQATMSPSSRPFRVLSVPCSTGEEPYSLVMAASERGVPGSHYVIDALDLSERHIEAARRGVYRDFAFRQTDPELRRRYFQPCEGGWQLDEAVRAQVQFQVGNILAPVFLLKEKPYDLVFCRNLHIYFTPAARQQAVSTLARLVVTGGLLALGHAEALDQQEKRFERHGPEEYFLYRRKSEATKSVGKEKETTRVRLASSPTRSGETPTTLPIVSPAPAVSPEPKSSLQRARELANLGRYVEARRLCEQSRQEKGPSADLYCLLGMLHQAQHDFQEANRCFTRALYLDPKHREALTHLMLLCQLEGDHQRARLLRTRLERLPHGDTP